jgi:hypothetical protein
MPRFHIKIVGVEDRIEQLRLANEVREDLIEHAEVWTDPEHPLQGVHRDAEGCPYFEFAADDHETIREVLNRRRHDAHIRLTETDEPLGEPCQDCGNIAGPILLPECPNCGFHDIERCPICNELYSRQDYEKISGNLFYCPTRQNGSRHRVRLIFNEPMFRSDGRFNQPLLLVKDAVRR